ncbi:hypothetical protein GCM10017044_28680 [Kordiimonas sediminis]|uniref:Hint domain-containing protein n=1 Tax=Kordiimonas sediminis TaxID=1735581 RepID=A0A919AXN3_9PROT|nr:polymorphic toxin-type HINT domain-containing protein [Kordiimonas sediminis]GHF31388.1 hypothetical protein GCM10017044_28680 [Kordiimonas sediminis]
MIWELTVQNEAGETETFETIDEHPWWVDGQGWKRTDELAFGMRVEDDEQRVLVVTSVRNTERKDGTYNLTVADFHTYFVGEFNVLVHNCGKKSTNGGKNGQKRNDDRVAAAQARLDDATKRRDQLKAKPNKTKEDKKALKKAEAEVKHETNKVNEISENHSMKDKK